MSEKECIRLAREMGWTDCEERGHCGDDYGNPYQGPTGISPEGRLRPLPDPFTDANDEASVFDHFSRQPFSERKKFFDALKGIVDQNVAFLTTTNEAHEIAWPWVLMYMRRGDIARAALRVLEGPDEP